MRAVFGPGLGRRLADGLLLALLVAVAFLLGCYKMGDSDVWWHLRGGQWILDHGRVPHLEPFTFGSADKVWIDIHWSYEVVLVLCHRAGGVGALVVLGASLGAAAFLVAAFARRRDWPVAVTVLCWLPALVLFAFRLDPRPEIFSLFYLSCFLAVLGRVEERPALVWLLVPVQILWVNAQGLFILGPVVLGLFVLEHSGRLLWRRWSGAGAWGPAERRWWRHVGGAALAVAVACLVNPYFLAGARFPFDLFPKVAEAGNVYKQYIDELQSPRELAANDTVAVAGANAFFRACHFLMLLLPVSFLVPAAWQARKAPLAAGKPRRIAAPAPAPHPGLWLGGLAVLAGVLALSTWTRSGKGMPGWVIALGDNVPLVLLAGGAAVAAYWSRRSRLAAGVALAGGVALAAWTAWLQTALFGEGRGLLNIPDPSLRSSLPVAAACGVAAVLVLRWGGSPFRMLLAAAFGYLALQALQNWTRFALVAGMVLVWNFGEWSRRLADARPPGRRAAVAGWGLRAGLAGLLAAWVVLLARDQYYAHTGEPRHFAFREQPLEFAHDAARFAGLPGLPDRALVYGLDQACVYTYHNAPRAKPFLDGRLEMPDRQTFLTYVKIEDWLKNKDPRWEGAVAALGNPLLLLDHRRNHNAEALLLTHPSWRCIYYDALASVFVSAGTGDRPSVFPTVDFAGRHFRHAGGPSVPDVKGAAAREARALGDLAAALPRDAGATWRWRLPVLLSALDRAQYALDEEPGRAEVWRVLGGCHWNLNPELRTRPPAPADDWLLETGLYWAQATYCYRRALEVRPDYGVAWHALADCYRARGMADSWLLAGEQWLTSDPKVPAAARAEVERVRRRLGTFQVHDVPSGQLPAVVNGLLRGGRPEAAARLAGRAEGRGSATWPWAFADRVAGLYMHLGRPADARRVWEQARDAPSAAVRHCRLAATFWVERDFESARRQFEAARAAGPDLATPCWGLAMLHAQLGQAGPALRACRLGLRRTPTERQRSDLESLQRLLLRYAAGGGERGAVATSK